MVSKINCFSHFDNAIQVVQPKPYKILLNEIESGIDPTTDEVRLLMAALRNIV